MPEKEAQGFGQSEKNELFVLDQNQGSPAFINNGSQSDEQIVLNISEAKNGKLIAHKKTSYVRLTGNPVIDAFSQLNDYFIDHSKVTTRDKATFYRLLSVMVNAGLPLIRSLRTLAFQSSKSSKLSRTLYAMADSIETGKSLSNSMEEFPDVFNEASVGMIKAGEASGQLNKTLKDLAEEVEKTASITGKIKGALVYPIAIFVLLIGVIFLMMVAVVPELTKLFTQTGQALPLPTQILIQISNFTTSYWYLTLLGVLFFTFAVAVWKKTKSGKYLWDLMLLKLPIFGSIIQKATLSKFARSFSNLLRSGVPIIKSLEIVANAVGNEVYKQRFFLTAEDMRRGIPMAENLNDSNLFPRMLVNMIEIGEQTAQLENVTLKVAEFYDDEVDTVVKALSKVMEPLILVIIGITVGGLVAAIMLPIIQLSDIAGKI